MQLRRCSAPGARVGRRLPILLLALLIVSTGSAAAFADGCKLDKLAEFPIEMVGLRPLMTAKINDVDVRFVVDSGAFYSMISAASAAELKLNTSKAPFGFFVKGVNGAADVSLASAQTFTLAGVAVHNVQFLVGGSEAGQGSIGLLGQNVLHLGDVEYDLGQGVVRLMRAVNCGKTVLLYWGDKSTPYSVIDLVSDPAENRPQVSHTLGLAYINGVQIRVEFDTGAATSILSLKAAAHAGIKPDSPGVVSAGTSYGIGKNTFASYIAPFASFKIGDEEIKNTRLRIGDIELPYVDMLIGADFFLSHRIYVANSQRKLYFTYNGGPVFNLSTGNRPVTDVATNASTQAPTKEDAAIEDAADYGRRGAALAARREFDQALTALSRACELAPDNSEYFYRRALVYWQLKRPDAAMADLDQAVKLKPDDPTTLIARAQLLLQRHDNDLAAADLDVAVGNVPREADQHYQMAIAYERADRLAAAVAQFTLWIDSHADDARLPDALNARCRIRALESAELPLAVKDCNAALGRTDKSNPFYAKVADSRGLVFLRMGEYDKSIADYNASLKIDAKNAWSLYGRGIAKLRKQETSAGEADIAQATAIWPRVGEEFKHRGIVP